MIKLLAESNYIETNKLLVEILPKTVDLLKDEFKNEIFKFLL